MTPIEASKNLNEKTAFSNLQDRRRIEEPQFQLRQLIRTADIEKTFSKGGRTNLSDKLYTLTEITHDTIPSY